MAFSMNAGRKTAMSEINVTPLVDVMLVLLIIFMVTAPMMQEGISLNPPEAPGQPLTKDPHAEDVVVSVAGPGKIFINDAPVTEDKLLEKMLEKTPDAKDRSTRAVYLRGDKSVPYGEVVRVMGNLVNAGFKNLNIITTSQEESPSKK